MSKNISAQNYLFLYHLFDIILYSTVFLFLNVLKSFYSYKIIRQFFIIYDTLYL